MANNSEYGFWVVWSEGGGPPTFKHENKRSAETEAKRLAVATPGQRFIVLEARTGFLCPDRFEVTEFDDIPF